MAATKAGTDNKTTKPAKGRRRASRVLVVLGALLAFVAMLSVWVERQVLNTDDWVETSAEMLENEQIRGAVADFLVDELYANVDMEREVEGILPDAVDGLAGPAAGGIRQGAGGAVERLLETGTAEDLWTAANRAAHSQLVLALEGGSEEIGTEEGVVTLDLAEMLRDLARQIGVSEDIADEIPDETADVVILRSDRLETAQDIARAVEGLALVLSILALLSFAGAVALARGERWVSLLGSGVGLVTAGFGILVLRGVAGDIVVSELVTDPSVEPAASEAWSIGTSLLAGIAVSVIFIGLALGLAAWLASPAPSALSVRRRLAPGLRDQLAFFYAGLAILLGLYLLLVGSHNLRSLLTVLVLAALAAFGLRELRRSAVAEFPDEPAWKVPDAVRSWFGSAAERGRERIRAHQDSDSDEEAETSETDAPPDRPAGQDRQTERSSEEATQTTRQPAAESPSKSGPASGAKQATGDAGAAEPRTGGAAPAPSDSGDLDQRLARLERLASLADKGLLSEEELAREKARILGE